MKSILKYISVIVLLLTLCACETEKYITGMEGGPVLELTTQDDVTRAFWSDDITSTGNATFRWEGNSNQLISTIKASGGFLRWGTADTYYSYTQVTPNDPNTSAKLRTVNGIHTGDQSKVTAGGGDKVYCVSPVITSTTDDTHPVAATISASSGAVSVSLPMPSEFPQTAMSQLDAEVFRNHAYIYANTTVQTASSQALTGVPVKFKTGISVVRFTITSSIAATIKAVSITALNNNEEADKIFPNTMTWNATDASNPLSEPADKSSYYSTIVAKINGTEGTAIAANATVQCYAYAFPSDLTEKSLRIKVSTGEVSYIKSICLGVKEKIFIFAEQSENNSMIKNTSEYEIPFINLIIRTFATRFAMSRYAAYKYLKKFQGLSFLMEFYDVEHLQDVEETVDDLVFYCKRYGGDLA